MNPRPLLVCAALCALWTPAAQAQDPPPPKPPAEDPLAHAVAASRARAGSMEEHDREHPDSPGATLVTEDGVIETITVVEELVETKKVLKLKGTKKPKAYLAISCGEHKKITLTNVAIATDGPAVQVSGRCAVTLVNSFIVSRAGPAILVEGKKASVTLDHCTVVGTTADGKTVAARVGKRSKLQATRTLFKGDVSYARKRDFKQRGVTIDVPAGEKKAKKKKKKKRTKRRRKTR